MACKVQPFSCGRPVECYSCDSTLKLDGSELGLFDSIAEELVDIGGTEIDVYQRESKTSSRDSLYDEVITDGWKGPYRISAWVGYPESDPEVTQSGFKEVWPSEVWIARVALEAVGARHPIIGDIIGFWRVPFYKEIAKTKDPKRGFYFGVTKVDDDGHLNDSSAFVGFKLAIKRDTTFSPERRLYNT